MIRELTLYFKSERDPRKIINLICSLNSENLRLQSIEHLRPLKYKYGIQYLFNNVFIFVIIDFI